MKLPFLLAALAPFAPAYTSSERSYDPLCQIHDLVFSRVRRVSFAYDQFALLAVASMAAGAPLYFHLGGYRDGPGSQYILGVRVFRGRGFVDAFGGKK